MTSSNRQLYLDANHKFTLREAEIPQPGKDEVVVKIMANGICGTDLHFYHDGRLGTFIVEEPYIPGHEASGVITSTGSGVGG